jgi:UDP-N-acetylmuramoylalanine--D-glutamate ligase
MTQPKRIVILGAGESGTGAALLAVQKGFDVFLSDNGPIKEKYRKELEANRIPFEESKHTEALILNADEVIKSPGIPDKAPLIVKLKEKNIPVINEIEFAGRYTNAKKICITGTNGKTTTTLLTYHLLKKGGLNVGLGGNVGQSFARQVATANFDYYVLELSSFQLDGMFEFKADVAVLCNITPDHLDRYDYALEKYVASKFRVTQNQTESDFFIYCADDELTTQNLNLITTKAKKLPFSIKQTLAEGAYKANEQLIIKYNNQEFNMYINELALVGQHNTYNSMAAGIVGHVYNLRKEAIRESLQDFENVEHRLEFVAKVGGIEFINDSKATNVNSAWYALECTDAPLIWIAGGQDKGNDYALLKPLVREKVKFIVCLGKDNRKIHEAFMNDVDMIINTTSAKEAVQVAYRFATKADKVLLSPACASFDLFENYEDRGRQFKKAVRDL